MAVRQALQRQPEQVFLNLCTRRVTKWPQSGSEVGGEKATGSQPCVAGLMQEPEQGRERCGASSVSGECVEPVHVWLAVGKTGTKAGVSKRVAAGDVVVAKKRRPHMTWGRLAH